jgi:hypothetical protein
MNMKVISITKIAVLVLTFSGQVLAGLYISDVEGVPKKAHVTAEAGDVTNIEGKEVTKKPDSYKPMGYGKGMPLSFTMSEILPHAQGWKANIDQGIEDYPINWFGNKYWKDVLSGIAETHGFSVVYNEVEKVVGVSKNSEIAKHLAKSVPTVWRVNASKSLRGNLEAWSGRAGWSVYWDSKVDYKLNNTAIFLGEFVGRDGVVDQLLRAFANKRTQLAAEFNTGNSVMRIHTVNFALKGEE